MAKVKQKEYRDYYILKFKDEEFSTDWKTGNLSRFMRNLWNVNEVLRTAWKKEGVKTDKEFSTKMVVRACARFLYHQGKTNTITVYFLPKSHEAYDSCYATITRFVPNALKGFQE